MHKTLKFSASLLTLTAFLFSQSAVVPNSFAAAAMPASEIQVGAAGNFTLPSDLGTVENLQLGQGPMIVHIQTAHGNYEAQKNIKGILEFLNKNYGFNTLLLEGSAYPLNPEVIRFFPQDMDLTRGIADDLTRKAIFKGADLFMIEHPKVKALGIENLNLYRENGDAFRSVLRQEEATENFVRDMNMQIERLTSPYLNKDLRSFLNRLDAYESKQIQLVDWVNTLKTEGSKLLGIDLSDPIQQVEWPMLLRLFTLMKFESKLDRNALAKEKTQFLKAIGGVSKDVYAQVESLLTQPVSRNQLPSPETELLFEKLVSKLPKDFNYKAFPNVCLFIGHLILQSEIKGMQLMGEVSALQDKISERLALTKEEKQILGLLKDHRLLKKLFALELTPSDYEKVLTRAKDMQPEQVIARFESLNSSKRVKDVKFSNVEKINELYTRALEFYRLVKERDLAMMKNVQTQMQDAGVNKAVVITGGFHAEPFQNFAAQQGIQYALIAPKITTADGREAYVQSILDYALNEPVKSTYEGAFIGVDSPELLKNEGVDPARLYQAVAASAKKVLAKSKVSFASTRFAKTFGGDLIGSGVAGLGGRPITLAPGITASTGTFNSTIAASEVRSEKTNTVEVNQYLTLKIEKEYDPKKTGTVLTTVTYQVGPRPYMQTFLMRMTSESPSQVAGLLAQRITDGTARWSAAQWEPAALNYRELNLIINNANISTRSEARVNAPYVPLDSIKFQKEKEIILNAQQVMRDTVGPDFTLHFSGLFDYDKIVTEEENTLKLLQDSERWKKVAEAIHEKGQGKIKGILFFQEYDDDQFYFEVQLPNGEWTNGWFVPPTINPAQGLIIVNMDTHYNGNSIDDIYSHLLDVEGLEVAARSEARSENNVEHRHWSYPVNESARVPYAPMQLIVKTEKGFGVNQRNGASLRTTMEFRDKTIYETLPEALRSASARLKLGLTAKGVRGDRPAAVPLRMRLGNSQSPVHIDISPEGPDQIMIQAWAIRPGQPLENLGSVVLNRGEKAEIGKSVAEAQNNIVIPQLIALMGEVSRAHLSISFINAGIDIEDLNSSKGTTFVDSIEQRISSKKSSQPSAVWRKYIKPVLSYILLPFTAIAAIVGAVLLALNYFRGPEVATKVPASNDKVAVTPEEQQPVPQIVKTPEVVRAPAPQVVATPEPAVDFSKSGPKFMKEFREAFAKESFEPMTEEERSELIRSAVKHVTDNLNNPEEERWVLTGVHELLLLLHNRKASKASRLEAESALLKLEKLGFYIPVHSGLEPEFKAHITESNLSQEQKVEQLLNLVEFENKYVPEASAAIAYFIMRNHPGVSTEDIQRLQQARAARSEVRAGFSEEDSAKLARIFKAWGIDPESAATLAQRTKNYADSIYVERMTAQHVAPKTNKQVNPNAPNAPLRIRKEKGELNKVSEQGNAVVTALLTAEELREYGVFQRKDLDVDPRAAEKYRALAAQTSLIWNTLDGGIGESLNRTTWLLNKGLRARLQAILTAQPDQLEDKYKAPVAALSEAELDGDTDKMIEALREIEKLAGYEPLQVKMGAKGTDLGRNENIRGNEYFVGDAEARLLFMTDLSLSQKFGRIAFQPLVNYQSLASYKKLLNSRYLLDVINGSANPRTYEQALTEAGVDILELLEQKDLPKFEVDLDKTQGFPTEDASVRAKGQPGGHGQWGVYFMIDFTENAPGNDGLKYHTRFFGNGDNRKGNPEPIVVGFTIDKKLPILKFTTAATAIDRKGGKEVVRIAEVDGKVVGILDQWEEVDASNLQKADKKSGLQKEGEPGQLDLFYESGQRNGFGREGGQLFNTNLFLFEIDLLHPILNEIRQTIGPDDFLDAIIPQLFDKIDKAATIDGKKYVSLDSAIGYVIHRLNTFYVTDPRLGEIRKKYGPQLLYYMNYDRDIFAPKKKAEDQYLQEGTDYYSKFDEAIKNFRDAEPGLTPPGFSITDPLFEKTGKPALDKDNNIIDSKFWNEAQHWLDSFGLSKVRRLQSLKVEGRVTIQNAEYIGDVVIINRFKTAEGDRKPANRVVLSRGAYFEQLKQLGLVQDGHIRLENLRVEINDAGVLTVRPIVPAEKLAAESLRLVDELKKRDDRGFFTNASEVESLIGSKKFINALNAVRDLSVRVQSAKQQSLSVPQAYEQNIAQLINVLGEIIARAEVRGLEAGEGAATRLPRFEEGAKIFSPSTILANLRAVQVPAELSPKLQTAIQLVKDSRYAEAAEQLRSLAAESTIKTKDVSILNGAASDLTDFSARSEARTEVGVSGISVEENIYGVPAEFKTDLVIGFDANDNEPRRTSLKLSLSEGRGDIKASEVPTQIGYAVSTSNGSPAGTVTFYIGNGKVGIIDTVSVKLKSGFEKHSAALKPWLEALERTTLRNNPLFARSEVRNGVQAEPKLEEKQVQINLSIPTQVPSPLFTVKFAVQNFITQRAAKGQPVVVTRVVYKDKAGAEVSLPVEGNQDYAKQVESLELGSTLISVFYRAEVRTAKGEIQEPAALLIEQPTLTVIREFLANLLPLSLYESLLRSGASRLSEAVSSVLGRSVIAAEVQDGEEALDAQLRSARVTIGAPAREAFITASDLKTADDATVETSGKVFIQYELLQSMSKNPKALPMLLEGYQSAQAEGGSKNPVLSVVLPQGMIKDTAEKSLLQALAQKDAGVADADERTKLVQAIELVSLKAGQSEAAVVNAATEKYEGAVSYLGTGDRTDLTTPAVFALDLGQLARRPSYYAGAALVTLSFNRLNKQLRGRNLNPKIRAEKLTEFVANNLDNAAQKKGKVFMLNLTRIIQSFLNKRYIETQA